MATSPTNKVLSDLSRVRKDGVVLIQLCVVSLTMTIGNKLLMQEYGFPNVLMFLQTLAAVLTLLAGIQLGQFNIKPITREQVKVFFVPTVVKIMQMYTSLRAFPLVAVATVVVFRNISTCAVAVCDRVIMKEPIGMRKWKAVAAIMLGVTIYAYRDINYDFYGYMWLLLNSAVFVFNTMWNRMFCKKTEQTSDGINLIQQTCMLPLTLLWAVMVGELDLSLGLEAEPLTDLFALDVTSKYVLLATCIGSTCIGSIYSRCYKLFSATMVTVVSNMIKFVSVFFACAIFSTQLTMLQVVGMVISIVAGVAYTILPEEKKPKKVRAGSHPNQA